MTKGLSSLGDGQVKRNSTTISLTEAIKIYSAANISSSIFLVIEIYQNTWLSVFSRISCQESSAMTMMRISSWKLNQALSHCSSRTINTTKLYVEDVLWTSLAPLGPLVLRTPGIEDSWCGGGLVLRIPGVEDCECLLAGADGIMIS